MRIPVSQAILMTLLLPLTVIPAEENNINFSCSQRPVVMTVLYDARFDLHDPGPGHPERANRVNVIVDQLKRNE